MQSIDSIGIYADGTSKNLVSEKEEIKCNSIIKNTGMINFDDVIKEQIKKHNPNWLQISDHPCRLLIIRGSGSGKTNSLFNSISYKPDIEKIYLYAKDPYQAKCQLLINKWKSTALKH